MPYSAKLTIVGIGLCIFLAEACFASELPRPVVATNTWTIEIICQSQEERDQLLQVKTKGNYVNQPRQWLKIGQRLNLSPEMLKAVNFDKELVVFSAVPRPNHIGWQNPKLTSRGELTFLWGATMMAPGPGVYGVNFTFYKLPIRPFIYGPRITKINGIGVRY